MFRYILDCLSRSSDWDDQDAQCARYKQPRAISPLPMLVLTLVILGRSCWYLPRYAAYYTCPLTYVQSFSWNIRPLLCIERVIPPHSHMKTEGGKKKRKGKREKRKEKEQKTHEKQTR